MSATTSDEHVWFRHRLADHLLDLLDDRETARLRAHATSCASCGGLLAAATRERAEGWLGADHPSPAALIRWQQAPESLDDVATRVITEHVDSCEACRADLAELGGELVARPALAATGRTGPAPFASRSRALDRALGATGGALATAAALLLFWQRPVPPPRTPSEPVPPASVREVSPPAVFLPLAGPVRVQSPTRGGDTITRIALADPRRAVPLVIPTLFIPDSTTLDVELVSERGDVVAHITPTAGEAQRTGIVLDTRSMGAEPFTLRIRWRRNGHEEVRRYPIVFQAE